MNGHWEELFGKVEELLHATDHPDNYRMLIQEIIRWSSDGRQRLESCTYRNKQQQLRLHVIYHVQGVIGAMSSSGASGCVLTLVDLQRRLVDRAKWIIPCRWINSRSIVDGAFDQVLRDHPDLRDAVNAQVSVLYSSVR